MNTSRKNPPASAAGSPCSPNPDSGSVPDSVPDSSIPSLDSDSLIADAASASDSASDLISNSIIPDSPITDPPITNPTITDPLTADPITTDPLTADSLTADPITASSLIGHSAERVSVFGDSCSGISSVESSIKAYSEDGLVSLFAEMKQPRFRALQLMEWLYGKAAASYDEMTNLPAALRTELAERHPLRSARVVDRKISADGTRKYVLEFPDGARVETVAIPADTHGGTSKERLTVCFSTQAGCPMACTFCATGKEGFTRNLLPGEIMDQILIAQADMVTRVSNLVAMGQGEPFLNYENVLAALRFANHPKCLGIGARHITVSTCGILNGIRAFSQEPEQFTLAVSLHSAQQETRDLLMSNMANAPLPKLKRALVDYSSRTKRRVTLEYILIRDVTDSPEALAALAAFCEGLLCHVNLLPINAIPGSAFAPSPAKTTAKWVAELERRRIETTVRNSRGSDIAGACGQLKNSL